MIFESLSPEHLETICYCLTPVSFQRGEPIVREGDDAKGIYFIHRGAAQVLASAADLGDGGDGVGGGGGIGGDQGGGNRKKRLKTDGDGGGGGSGGGIGSEGKVGGVGSGQLNQYASANANGDGGDSAGGGSILDIQISAAAGSNFDGDAGGGTARRRRTKRRKEKRRQRRKREMRRRRRAARLSALDTTNAPTVDSVGSGDVAETSDAEVFSKLSTAGTWRTTIAVAPARTLAEIAKGQQRGGGLGSGSGSMSVDGGHHHFHAGSPGDRRSYTVTHPGTRVRTHAQKADTAGVPNINVHHTQQTPTPLFCFYISLCDFGWYSVIRSRILSHHSPPFFFVFFFFFFLFVY